MTIIPTLQSIFGGARRCGLGGCLLAAGLLVASVHPGRAAMAVQRPVAAPVTQVHPAAQEQDLGRPEPASAPSVATPAPSATDPVTTVGFGWG